MAGEYTEYRYAVPDGIDLALIARSGQCFRWRGEGEGYLIPFGREEALAVAPDRHTLLVRAPGGGEALWRRYFDLDTDYAAIAARVPAGDTFLREAAQAQYGLRILRQEPWEMLVTSIMTQNRSIPIISASVEKLCAAAGEPCRGVGGPFYAFPAPAAILALPDEALRACALGYRARYVRAAARAAAEGRFDPAALEALDDEACREALLALDGVGLKVAACAMLFGLHRLDAFPVDVWMNRVMAEHYPGGWLRADYSPYGGVYQQYMFAWARHLRGADAAEHGKTKN